MLNAEQSKIVEQYEHWARGLAYRMARNMPRSTDREALASEAVVGLMDAVRLFNPEVPTPFKAYAYRRVVGHLRDAMRADTSFVHGYLACRSRANPGRPIKLASLAGFFQPRPVSRSEPMNPIQTGAGVRDPKQADPSERQDLRDHLRLALKVLSKRQRLIVLLYHVEGLLLREIGQALGITESMTSVEHTAAMALMRERAAFYQSTKLGAAAGATTGGTP